MHAIATLLNQKQSRLIIAGIPFRLSAGLRPPRDTSRSSISITWTDTPHRAACPPPAQAIRIHGQREYRGWYDPETRVGELCLMGHHPEAALVSYLRQVATWLVYRHGGLVMHSATLISRQHALIFYGHSGAGKTTLCQHAPSRTPILTDDLTGLIKTRGKWRAWGMPTLTHAHWIKQTQGIRVKALFRLIKATVTRIDPISSARAAAQAACFPHVLGNTRPWTEPLLDRLADLAQSVRCFDLHFEKTGAYWDLVSKRIDFQPIQ